MESARYNHLCGALQMKGSDHKSLRNRSSVEPVAVFPLAAEQFVQFSIVANQIVSPLTAP